MTLLNFVNLLKTTFQTHLHVMPVMQWACGATSNLLGNNEAKKQAQSLDLKSLLETTLKTHPNNARIRKWASSSLGALKM